MRIYSTGNGTIRSRYGNSERTHRLLFKCVFIYEIINSNSRKLDIIVLNNRSLWIIGLGKCSICRNESNLSGQICHFAAAIHQLVTCLLLLIETCLSRNSFTTCSIHLIDLKTTDLIVKVIPLTTCSLSYCTALIFGFKFEDGTYLRVASYS